jgi:hypothetical protein
MVNWRQQLDSAGKKGLEIAMEGVLVVVEGTLQRREMDRA